MRIVKIPHFLKLNKKKTAIVIILVVVALLAFNNFTKPKTEILQFASVKRQDIKSIVSSSGNLTGKNVADLKFKSSGKLVFINVKAGDSVFAGEIIAGLDNQDLNIKLQQALNTYRDKQATAEKIEDDVKDHSKDETFAQKATRTTAQAARDSAYDSVKEAQRAFQDNTITSPIAGLITKTSYIPGQLVGSDSVVQVVDFSSFYFDTDIDEADIGKISLGQRAKITLDAFTNKAFEGSVDQIIPQTKTTSSGATVITVRINLGKVEITPVNGLSGEASIILSEARNVLTLPQEAVREDNTVFVQTQSGLRMEKVETGIKSDTDVEIKKGLSEKDRVLLNPPANGNFQNRSQNPLNSVLRFLGGSTRRISR